MAPRSRLFIGSIAALLAWMAGYGMGGGFRIAGKGGAAGHAESAAAARGTLGRGTGAIPGIARPATETLDEQLAARRGKWTPERLRASIEAIGHEADIIHAARFTIKLTDQLGPEDFPLALTAFEDAKDELHDELEIYRMLALARWADLDPQAVGAFLKANEKLGGKWFGPSEMDLVLGSWSAANPLGAMAWVKSLKGKDVERFLSETDRRAFFLEKKLHVHPA